MSREEPLALIEALRAGDADKDEWIGGLLVMVGELTAQVQALVPRLGEDSSTSSRPQSPGWVVTYEVGTQAQ